MLVAYALVKAYFRAKRGRGKRERERDGEGERANISWKSARLTHAHTEEQVDKLIKLWEERRRREKSCWLDRRAGIKRDFIWQIEWVFSNWGQVEERDPPGYRSAERRGKRLQTGKGEQKKAILRKREKIFFQRRILVFHRTLGTMAMEKE